ncbi:ABC transporter ATP-binding protein [Mesorhizobium sp. B2-4-19]|uniref:ABC transporter ATP-binding protein n=1 Tax=Mesorhizobium sp. B2-4-19 TaxID=2589930 RepID=UPI00112C4618|nr:ABC transporter ATP-binding protein [Mesorhizobium sp. B2-4-19]TPK53011.1 ABC transporter ATP-binding protein [Mesorhizobium sp. B2-4-19]
MTVPFLQIRNIHKTYGNVVAVKDVTLDIAKGEFITFLGPSGSGKSSTLYALAGLQEPTSGDILLHGRTLLDTPSHKRNIGMVFQRYTLFPHLSVGENVAFPLRVRRRPKAEIQETVRRVLKLVRLEGFEDRMPAKMSGGQQQRVALARALAYDPPVLLMDEPLSALDKKLREEIQLEIRRIHRETGVTILYVTHDQDEALRLSDRIAVFSKGVIDQVGTGAELYANPASRFVAEFIGDSDFLKGRVEAIDGRHADIRIAGDVVVQSVPVHGDPAHGGEVSVMLRPEHISLSQVPSAEGSLPVTVIDITFLGNNTHVLTETSSHEKLSVRLPFGHAAVNDLQRGQAAWVSWDSSMATAFCG